MGKSGFALVVAGVLAALAWVGMNKLLREREQQMKKELETSTIIVAKQALLPGDELKDSTVDFVSIPKAGRKPFMITKDEYPSFLYRPITRKLERGEPIISSDLGTKGEGLSAFAVEAGYRLLTIAVDEVSGVAGLVERGARVDILLSMTLAPEQAGPGQKGGVTRMLLTNVLVHETGAGGRAMRRRLEERGREYSTVTLVVTPREAQIIAYAQAEGHLSLLLRGPGDASIVDPLPAITVKNVFEESDAALKARRQGTGSR